MLVPATLLPLFCHFLVSVQAETYARVNFTLRCDSPEPFRYTATLIEVGKVLYHPSFALTLERPRGLVYRRPDCKEQWRSSI